MIYVRQRVDLKEDQTLYVIPIGDVHYNSDECDRDRFKRLITRTEKLKARGDIVYGIGLGDYNDALPPSGRMRRKQGYGDYDTTKRWQDRGAKKLSDKFYQAVKGLEWLGLCEGHHYIDFSEFMEPEKYIAKSNTVYLCDLVNTKFLGTLGVIDLLIGNQSLRICATHGYGGARTAGARVQKRVRMSEVVNANIYLMGHDDEKMAKGAQILDFTPGGRYVAKKVVYVATGSFQRAYHLGRPIGDYVEQLMLPPAQLGVAIIEIRLEFRGSRQHLDWHVSI